jgi:hypothetical protein
MILPVPEEEQPALDKLVTAAMGAFGSRREPQDDFKFLKGLSRIPRRTVWQSSRMAAKN